MIVEFHGGPMDGQRRDVEVALPFLRFPCMNAGKIGAHVYVLSPRYKLPPLRYNYQGDE